MAETITFEATTPQDARQEIREKMRRRKSYNEEFVHGMLAAIDNSPKALIPSKEKDNLQIEVRIRASLATGEIAMVSRQYDHFIKEMDNFDTAEGFNFLWTEWEHKDRLKHVMKTMELNDGEYCTENPIPGAPLPLRHQEVENYLNGFVGANNFTEEDRHVIEEVSERLLKTTGMWTYYTGPRDDNSNLIEKQILDETDQAMATVVAAGGTLLTGRYKYMGNKFYHEGWKRKLGSFPNFKKLFNNSGSDKSNQREIFQYAAFVINEGRVGVNEGRGKAASLRKNLLTFITAFPIANGYRNLEEYIDAKSAHSLPDTAFSLIDWCEGVKDANEIRSSHNQMLNNPLNPPVDVKEMKNNITNLAETMTKQTRHLLRIGLASYAARERMGAVIGYLNGKSEDRKVEFRETPRLGPEYINELVRVFGNYMNAEERKHFLEKYHAPESHISAEHISHEVINKSGTLGFGLLKQVLGNFGIKF